MQNLYRAALMVAAIVLFMPVSGQAQIKAGSFEVSPFVGYSLFENDQNLDNAKSFGGRLGYNFTKNWGLEVVVEHLRTGVDNKSVSATKEGQYGGSMDDVELTFYHLDVVYHFMPDSKFTPFVIAGVGGGHYSPAISNTDMAAINLGVGAKYLIKENISLRVDLRDTMVTEFFQETYHNLGVTVGLTFSFGGNEKAAPAKAVESAPEPVVVVAPEPKPEPKPVAVVVAPKVEEKYVVLAFEDTHFGFDQSSLTTEAKVALQKNLQVLHDNPNAKVRIEGYTSAAGSVEYNQGLSERRAAVVRNFLIQEGQVDPDRLTEVGYGKADPARFEASPEKTHSKAAKANMRVLFKIIVIGE